MARTRMGEQAGADLSTGNFGLTISGMEPERGRPAPRRVPTADAPGDRERGLSTRFIEAFKNCVLQDTEKYAQHPQQPIFEPHARRGDSRMSDRPEAASGERKNQMWAFAVTGFFLVVTVWAIAANELYVY